MSSFYLMIKVFEDVVEILDPEMNIDSETDGDEMQVNVVYKLLCKCCHYYGNKQMWQHKYYTSYLHMAGWEFILGKSLNC